MRWGEISIEVKCNAAEEVASIASDYAPAGVAVLDPSLIDEAKRAGGLSELELGSMKREGNAIVCFFAPDDEAELAALLSEMRKRLDKEINCSSTGQDVISINVRMVDEAEWTGWKQSFKPFRLGSKLLVSPTWENPDALPEDLVIRLDPGQAFGTGQHATTAGCAHMLEKYIKGGERVLDVGTGTGILAIASAMLGAGVVVAIDIDQVAVKCASDNVSVNKVADKVKVVKGDLLKGQAGPFDVIVANILAGPVIDMTGPAAALLSPGGIFITSGYIQKTEPDVKSALERSGLEIADRAQEGDWVCLVGRKPGK